MKVTFDGGIMEKIEVYEQFLRMSDEEKFEFLYGFKLSTLQKLQVELFCMGSELREKFSPKYRAMRRLGIRR